jgi:hypothetical protein
MGLRLVANSNGPVRRRRKKQLATGLQHAQRQLAWILYISEGYRANLAIASRDRLKHSHRAQIAKIEQSLEYTTSLLRELLWDLE